jgi:BirA family biotin operon repressor/biotin-[acetyl-CoA-carboxylase] ligase
MIRALREAGDGYLNGAELAKRFGCTRSAIWKKMRVLRDEGYPIDAIPNRGYRLGSEADRFRAMVMENLSADPCVAGVFTVHVADVTESTNLIAREAAEAGAPENSVFVGLYQQSGRGRRGRSWVSAPGEGLCFSILVRPRISTERSGMLSLLFGLCVYKAITALYPIRVGIKWPNDIVSMVNGKKLCGILSESSFEDDRLSYAVIGCGINIMQKRFPEPLREIATSLLIEGVPNASATTLLAVVLKEFSRSYPTFASDPTGFLDEYRRNCATLGREVMLVGENRRNATATNISDRGELTVRFSDGTETLVNAGEVSVRGMEGYS